VPQVFLCSRTHSQLRQLLAELKQTPYRPKYTVLGSRQQFCDRQEVVKSKGGADLGCKLLVRVSPPHPPCDRDGQGTQRRSGLRGAAARRARRVGRAANHPRTHALCHRIKPVEATHTIALRSKRNAWAGVALYPHC
jgi:hypothetical protein